MEHQSFNNSPIIMLKNKSILQNNKIVMPEALKATLLSHG